MDLFKNQNWQTKKPAVVISAIILCLIIMALLLGYSSTLSNYSKEYVNLTDKLNVDILKIIKHATDSEKAKAEAFPQLFESKEHFGDVLSTLTHGDPNANLPATPAENQASLSKINTHWLNYKKDIETILSAEKTIRITKKFSDAINGVMPDIATASEDIITELINKKGQANLIFVASHQLLLAQRITTSINQIQQQSKNTNHNLDMLITDTATFRNVLESMIKGNKSTGLKRIKNKALRSQVESLLIQFETVEELVIRVQEKTPQLVAVQKAANALIDNADSLLNSINQLSSAYEESSSKFLIYDIVAYIFGLIALSLFVSLGSTINKVTQERLAYEEESNKKTLATILKLQQEILPIAEGDLTASATVTPGITESIAEAVNFSIEALRKLVTEINSMSARVSDTAEETQATAILLSRASDKQAQQLTVVAKAINTIVQSFTNVAKQAEESSQLANQSVDMAEQGGLTVRNTIKGMQTITEDIHEASNRIKRLGESSQEIGDIVELIKDIADQTNILALNAAIKASVVGSEGQNFTVVADEVQQLAERVTQATQKIESLVQSIQLDTNQAVISMEQSSADVLHGTKVAEAAGDALLRIETVSAHLSDFISKVATATSSLTDTSKQVSQNMNAIKKTTDHNLAGTKQTAALTGKLAELAKEQRLTVNGFKLPQT